MLFGCWFTVNTISQLWLCSWWPKTPRYPTTISFPTHHNFPNSLHLTGTPTLAVHHLRMYHRDFFLSSQWAFGFPRLFVWDPVFSQGNTQPSSTLSHCRPMYDIFLVLFGVCCFTEPNRGDWCWPVLLLRVRSRHQYGHQESVLVLSLDVSHCGVY